MLGTVHKLGRGGWMGCPKSSKIVCYVVIFFDCVSGWVPKYDFIDSNPYSGINYYRLIQTDYNGNYKIFRTIAVENNSVESITLKRVNFLGQEVDEYYKGIYIEYYSDRTCKKFINCNK